MPVQIAPVKVQGEGSAEEIAAAIDIFNQRKETDVIIVARGGGSLEDLQAFNSEIVARAIADSNIPVVSAVGHETDFTICDFVADMRAPTPSAGAEIVVPEKSDVINYLVHTQERVSRTIRQQLSTLRQRLVETERRLVAPEKRLIDLRLRLDDFVLRAQRAQHTLLKTQVERHGLALKRLCLSGPHVHVEKLKKKLEYCNKTLSYTMRFRMDSWQHAFQVALGKLNAMNPLSVLERGYSVTRTWPKGELVRTTDQVGENQQVSVTLSHGSLVCRVEEIEENDKAEDV